MHVSQQGLDLIKKYEGCVLTAYPDPGSGGDPWTIGYGHTKGVKKGDVITKEQALEWLEDEADEFASEIIDACAPVDLNQNQLDAVTCLVYNIGIGNFKKSTVLAMIKKQKWAEAANAFEMWNKAAKKVMPGLVVRRGAEKALFLTPVKSPVEPVTEPSEAPATLTPPEPTNGPESGLKPDAVDKPLHLSKEIGAGVATMTATGTQLFNSLSISDVVEAKNATQQYQTQVVQNNHSIFHRSEVIEGLSVVIFLMGAFIVYKRIKDRLEGKR